MLRRKCEMQWLGVVAVMFLALGTCSCAVQPSAPEPVLNLDIYRFDLQKSQATGRCLFINGDAKRIDTDEPTIHEMVLIPASNLELIQDKTEHCVRWR